MLGAPDDARQRTSWSPKSTLLPGASCGTVDPVFRLERCAGSPLTSPDGNVGAQETGDAQSQFPSFLRRAQRCFRSGSRKALELPYSYRWIDHSIGRPRRRRDHLADDAMTLAGGGRATHPWSSFRRPEPGVLGGRRFGAKQTPDRGPGRWGGSSPRCLTAVPRRPRGVRRRRSAAWRGRLRLHG
jgi:hypothetical protein